MNHSVSGASGAEGPGELPAIEDADLVRFIERSSGSKVLRMRVEVADTWVWLLLPLATIAGSGRGGGGLEAVGDDERARLVGEQGQQGGRRLGF